MAVVVVVMAMDVGWGCEPEPQMWQDADGWNVVAGPFLVGAGPRFLVRPAGEQRDLPRMAEP